MPAQQHLLKRAISFSQAGDQQTARQILKGIIKADDTNQSAWIHYAKTFPTLREQEAALSMALKRHPDLDEVRLALRLAQRQGQAQACAYDSDVKAIPATGLLAAGMPAAGSRPAARPAPRPASRQAKGSIAPFLLTLCITLALLGSVVYYNERMSAQAGLLQQVRQEYAGLQTTAQDLRKSLLKALSDLQAERDRTAALNRQVADQQNRYNELTGQHTKLTGVYQALKQQFEALTNEFKNLQEAHNSLINNFNALQQEHQTLSANHDVLRQQHESLSGSYQALDQEKQALQNQYNWLEQEFNNYRKIAVTPPYIRVRQRQVTMAFYLRDQSITYWTVPFEMLEQQIQSGNQSRGWLFMQLNRVALKRDGELVQNSVDFRTFVDAAPFSEIIPGLYSRAGSDEAFLQEVWFMVSQLTNYTSDNGKETPRYPLETLLAGGGDCEDTSILYASMVKAAPVNWKVSLGHINGQRPYDLVKPNHIIVKVDTGSEVYYIETTGGVSMTPYTQTPAGWYLEIP